METFEHDEHEWFLERIGAAIAGGLGSDRGRFEEHAAACARCAAEWERAILGDQKMMDLFATARPGVGFENAVIEALRKENPRRRLSIHPVVWRVASAAAAAVVVAGIGYAGSGWVQHGRVDQLFAWGGAGEKSGQSLIESVSAPRAGDGQNVFVAPSSNASPDPLTGGNVRTIDGSEPTFAVGADVRLGAPSTNSNDLALLPSTASASAQQRVANSNNHNKEGENVIYRDGRAQFSKSAFAGGSRDNTYSVAGSQSMVNSPYAANDSVLLPTDDDAVGDSSYKLSVINNGANSSGTSIAGADVTIQLSDHKAVVDDLVNLAKTQIAKDDYAAAKGVISQVKSLDPNNEFAKGKEHEVQDRVVLRELNKLQSGNTAYESKLGDQVAKHGESTDGTKFEPTSNFKAVGKTGTEQTADSGYLGREHRVDEFYFKPGDVAAKAFVDRFKSVSAVNSDDAGKAQHSVASADGPANGPAKQTEVVNKVKDIRDLLISPTFDPTINVAGGTFERGGSIAKDDVTTTMNTSGAYLASRSAAEDNNGAPNTSGGQGTPAPVPPAIVKPVPGPAPVEAVRKVIRHGEVTFEVDSFDSAAVQIAKIVEEERGFVSTTDSEKLENGKVSGTITVRVPPDNLDVLVLKLRGLGDLTGQKITADDVTREYTDLQSELRAAQAMEDRLMDIVKTGKGEVKDLVEAEKELGVWREKAEKVTGQINYYNNLVAMSTLQIGLTERDLRQAALATEMETVSAGIETEDVEKARESAIKAIDELKGRVTQSDLKQLDAGQYTATIVAEISPDQSGPLTDRLRQLGRVARMDVGRQQTTANGAPVTPGIKVEKKDTQFSISLYNLANIQPRQTTIMNMACTDVEKTYADVTARVAKAGGRIVNSNLNRPKSDQIDATIRFETPADAADAALSDIRVMGDVMHLTVTENPDTVNVTPSKKGFEMTLVSLASVKPRETIQRTLMAGGSVGDAYRMLLDAANTAGARITKAELQESGGPANTGASLEFEVPRTKLDDIEKAVTDAIGPRGKVVRRQSSKTLDTDQMVDSKVGMTFAFVGNDALAARETISRVLAVPNVPAAYNAIKAAAQSAGAKIDAANLNEAQQQNIIGVIDLVTPQAGVVAIEKAITDAKGGVISREVRQSADLENTSADKVALMITIRDVQQISPRQTTTLQMQVGEPEKDYGDIQLAAVKAGGSVIGQELNKDSAHVIVDVPLSAAAGLLDQIRGMGTVKGIQQVKDADVPDADFARAVVDVRFASEAGMVGEDTGLWSTLKSGLGTSIRGLLMSLELIVVGLCLIVPWVLVIWGSWKGYRRWKPKVSARA